jgi:hypothetical protein
MIFIKKTFLKVRKGIILSESEKEKILLMHRKTLLNEQPDSKMPFQVEKFGYRQSDPSTLAPALKAQGEAIRNFPKHEVLAVLEIGSFFIPVVGPFLSAGLGMLDASIYAAEGDKETAGLTAGLTLLPLIGPIVKKIPGIKTLGTKGMEALSKKIAPGVEVALTPIEKEVAEGLAKEKSLVQNYLNFGSKSLESISPQIKQYGPKYTQKFGQLKYDDLISKYISGNIDAQMVIIALTTLEAPDLSKYTSTPLSNYGSFLGKSAVTGLAKTGCTFGDCVSGGGTYVWSTGNYFTGTFKGGKKDGQGTFTFTDKSMLTPMSSKYGNWVQDIKQGIFYYTNPNKIKFTVRYKDDKLICPKVETLESLNEITDQKQADKTSAACRPSVPNTRIQSIQKTLGLKPTGYMNQSTIDTLTQKLST